MFTSFRLSVGLADEQASKPGLDDGARIATNRLAMPLEDIHLVPHQRDVAEDVAHVGVLGDQLERPLLAAPADHDRRTVGLDGSREVQRTLDAVVAALEGW